MIRHFSVVLLFIFCVGLWSVSAQPEDDPTIQQVQVFVDSAFTRIVPLPDAKPAASVFEGDILEAIGRNVDGTWFEVRRRNRAYSLGWISIKMVSNNFNIEFLPLTDSTTGVTGSSAIDDSGFAAYFNVETVLRGGPFAESPRIGIVPFGAVIPVVARNWDATRLQVNYLGQVGWVSASNLRPSYDFMLIPVAAGLPQPEKLVVEIIPPEIQLAQVQRFRDFLTPLKQLSIDLESFWYGVVDGSILPCNPPASIADYVYGSQDIRELPELQRIAPRIGDGVETLNTSIDILSDCGAITLDTALAARNATTNAKIIFSVGLNQLKDLEENVIH
ncbi:MAG: SH3 domain-containing protein [Anaerolineae bacterium]